MITYENDMVNAFPEEIIRTMATPAVDFLFEVRKSTKATKSSEEQAIAFCHNFVNVLILSNWARCDIQTPVVFFTTRVKEPDDNDWGKLKRVLKDLNGTKNLCHTLHVDEIGVIKWYMDASYATNDKCRV